ncbi:hypothetical protein FLL45_04545 [Aliikangiella marina]|uniref:Uncharacterized protein n=1 Tax=Aliikangiella marina TaxID=1712262 RepID=A0A545TJ15_9GAMM|nr:hypothetical protein [Aliikangiella marina]TQV77220.1 hypothetical protein FLL45_04545 [Aliikangiella marina]
MKYLTKPLLISLVLSIGVIVSVSSLSLYLFESNALERKVMEWKANSSDSHKILIDALKDNHKTYINNVWSTMGFLMLAIGWVVTSDKARNYWQNSHLVRNISLLAVLTIMIFHITILYDISRESGRLMSLFGEEHELVGLSYYNVNARMVLGSAMVNGSFFLLLWALITLQIPNAKSLEDNPPSLIEPDISQNP